MAKWDLPAHLLHVGCIVAADGHDVHVEFILDVCNILHHNVSKGLCKGMEGGRGVWRQSVSKPAVCRRPSVFSMLARKVRRSTITATPTTRSLVIPDQPSTLRLPIFPSTHLPIFWYCSSYSTQQGARQRVPSWQLDPRPEVAHQFSHVTTLDNREGRIGRYQELRHQLSATGFTLNLRY